MTPTTWPGVAMAARPITTAESMPSLRPTTIPRDPALDTRAFIQSAMSFGRMCIGESDGLDAVAALNDAKKRVNQHWIELAPAFPFDLGDRLIDSPGVFVRTLLRQGIEDVCDRHDAAGQRDRVARDAGVPAAVPAFVM